jgi:hypothetical protein
MYNLHKQTIIFLSFFRIPSSINRPAPGITLVRVLIPNASMFYAKDLCSKIFEIEAEIAGVAGSYAQNRQRKYQEFYSKD